MAGLQPVQRPEPAGDRLKPLPPYPMRRGRGPVESLLHAWNGLIHTIVFQRNMRIHVVAAILVGLVGSGIPLGLAEKVTLIFCVLFVMFAEILNSALEQLVDLAIQQFDEKARITKDAAAAGVLLLAIGTVVIFAAILIHNWSTIASHQAEISRQVLFGAPLAICSGILVLDRNKPAWVDALFFAGGCALWVALWVRTESMVFSALILGLLVVSLAAALRRRHNAAAGTSRGEKK